MEQHPVRDSKIISTLGTAREAQMKRCPVCDDVALKQILLEEDLPAHFCMACEGIWISSKECLSWSSPQEGLSTEGIDLDADLPLPVVDNRQALLCSDCGRILRRFKIWPDVEFHLDRCGGCHGIWFDRNEWQVLKLKNLHKKVHVFFTAAWQATLRKEEMRRRFAKMYQEKFGLEEYNKIKKIRKWLEEHPQNRQLLAYLTDHDPYRG
ncbi:MAG: hypothetical protein D3923_17585 [Candidatus Electrothrix sp. AR3]|nr:hypothetical protein [Candidatus Electrothrix sp. AR3]